MRELTLELTNYCPHACSFCSSDTTSDRDKACFLSLSSIKRALHDKLFDRVILSGGEPLAHPDFYDILFMAKNHAKDVIVYSNALKHIAYNAAVIDGIYVEAMLTVRENTKKVRILKRVKQGREATRPEVSFSSNWTRAECSCDHVVVRPDGRRCKPCRKTRCSSK